MIMNMPSVNAQTKNIQQQRPQLPKKKMPRGRAIMMFGTAFFLSMIIFIFSIFPITAPIIVGVGASVYVQQKTGSKVAGEVAGWAAVTFSWAAELLSGVGVAFVEALGTMMTIILTFLGWTLFFFWFTLSGISFMGGGGRANKRMATAIVSFIIGLIPLVDIIPSLLIGITTIIISTYLEDKEKLATYKIRLKKYEALQKHKKASAYEAGRPVRYNGVQKNIAEGHGLA